jgi:hypothetical protein
VAPVVDPAPSAPFVAAFAGASALVDPDAEDRESVL